MMIIESQDAAVGDACNALFFHRPTGYHDGSSAVGKRSRKANLGRGRAQRARKILTGSKAIAITLRRSYFRKVNAGKLRIRALVL